MVNELKWGDRVRLKGGTIEAIIDRLGTHSGLYRVVPELGGFEWHTSEELEKVGEDIRT